MNEKMSINSIHPNLSTAPAAGLAALCLPDSLGMFAKSRSNW